MTPPKMPYWPYWPFLGQSGGWSHPNFRQTQTTKGKSKMKTQARLPQEFKAGTKVRDIYTGRISTVKCAYWQWYAGGDTSDYTVEFVEYGWNKSTNLEEISAQ